MKFYALRQNFVYVLTFIACLVISFGISWKVYEWQRTFNFENFRHTARENFLYIRKSIEWHQEGIVSISNYFLSSENITQDEFKSYTNYKVNHNNGYDAMGWIDLTKDPKTPYKITHINTEDTYIYRPLADIEKDPAFIALMDKVKISGKTYYTIETNLASNSPNMHLLAINPTIFNGQIIGYAFSVIDIPVMIEKSVGDIHPYLHLSITANVPENAVLPLYETTNRSVPSKFYAREKMIELNGLSLSFVFLPTPEFLKEYNFMKTYVLFIGVYLVLCVLAILYFRQLNSHIIRIREAQRRAEESSRLKNDFLATMSHEIRSPMSGVLGMAELLLSTNLTPDQRGYTQTILNSGEVLLNIIEDILDVSKIEADKLKIDAIPINMLDLVDEVCALYSCKAQEKAVELAVHYIPGSEQFVYADPVRVRQVLGNLINNAIKFTEKGHVIVTVREDKTLPYNKMETRLIFNVEDTGIGISREAMGRIFEQFSQADNSTTRNYGGTGLGLTISKKLVELMGGEISVISEQNIGSTFSFSLPLRRNAEESFSYPKPPVLEGVKVLIVDDLPVIGSILSENLGLNGMVCTWEPDPRKAFTLLEAAHRDNRPFQIAILDFLMPGMNGEALAKKIKQTPTLKETCLIMLTAAGNPSTENVLLKDCFSAYLAKPIRVSQMIEKLAVIWGMYTAGYRDVLIKTDSFAYTPETKQVFTPLTGVKILLAEDSRINQAFAIDVLEQLSCKVKVVINGEEAVKILQQEDFDIILMDCQMPVMDGFEATREIMRLKDEGVIRRDLPIIALTANAMEGDRERCLDTGMDDYLSKPVRAKELREKVYQWLNMEDNMYVDADPTGSMIDRAPAHDLLVDPESVQEARKILKDKYDEMVGYYLEDTQNYIDQISTALKDGRFGEGIRPAHTIKSTSQRMGAAKLSICAKELEALLKTHENDNFAHLDAHDVAGFLTHLRLVFDQTRPLLAGKKS